MPASQMTAEELFAALSAVKRDIHTLGAIALAATYADKPFPEQTVRDELMRLGNRLVDLASQVETGRIL